MQTRKSHVEKGTLECPDSHHPIQSRVSPQVDSLAHALIVPYPPSHASTSSSTTTYVPLAFALASSFSSHPGSSMESFGAGRNMATGNQRSTENHVFTDPYGSGGGIVDRPMGRAFTLPPTPAPQSRSGSEEMSQTRQASFGFSQWANGPGFSAASAPITTFASASTTAGPVFGVPFFNLSTGHQTSHGIPASAGFVEHKQEPLVKREDELMMSSRESALVPSVGYKPAEPGVIRAFPRLGSMDLTTLTARQALFFFGVLTTQALLLPRFEFNREVSGRWGVKLTLYGHTLSKPELFGTQAGVKVEVCREALEILKVQYPQWVVPDEPSECLTGLDWDWVRLLHDYCMQNNVDLPKYTKYIHENGYRYEVEVSTASYFGALKSYPTDAEARNASAHMGLYSVLVHGLNETNSFPGPSLLKQNQESSLPLVPKAFECGPTRPGNQDTGLSRTTPSGFSGRSQITAARTGKVPVKPQNRSKKPAKPEVVKGSSKKEPRLNSNLVPLVNRRINDIESFSKPANESRWTVTPRELRFQIHGLGTHRERLEKICDLLALEYPEYEIERTDGRLIDSVGAYRAAAFFPCDPFLARVGAIGEVRHLMGDRTAAREICSRNVVEYLIRMVEEDTVFDAEAAVERQKVERWKENAISTYVKQGLIDPEDGEMQDI